jgi:signal transduction histidine kinase
VRSARARIWHFIVRHALVVAVLATVLVGIADWATGVDVTIVQLAYLAPVVLASWFAGTQPGLGVAILAGICAAISQIDGEKDWMVIANAIGCGGVFIVVAQLAARLHHYVAREQLQRHVAVEQLRHAERLTAIGVLAAGVAHELGTPLNVIAGTAELLDIDPGNSDAVRRGSATIVRQTQKLSAIIQHLLAFGRRGSGTREVVDLDRVATSATELLEATARKRKAKIEHEVAAEPVRVRAADAQVEQVISNLVLNAIQAMPRGGIVRVRTCVEMREDVDRTPRAFGSVVVEDEGMGIAPADLSRIFDPFFTTKGVGEGTGLGLSVSYGIVQDHGGSIEVDSREGYGTRFTVLLPLAG